ncbi:MAG: hypothetical protein JO000_04395 [Alphaproteobacteria bacterium]|nr:hypothetical protein [Alphaproteobacteria bacterium]
MFHELRKLGTRRGLLIALALMLLGLVHADLARAGDFGRPSPSLLEGLIPKQFWKGPVVGYSSAPITDLEEELRDRSYALIRPNEPRGNWNLYIAGFQLAHLLPPPFIYYDHTEYARMLLWTPSRSEASLYNRLMEDLDADGRLIGPFVAVACMVADLDIKREKSLVYVSELAEWETQNVFGRIRENRMITAWVQRALHWRFDSYRYALERFAIAIPSVRAVEAERALLRFRDAVLAADGPLIRCAGAEFIAAGPPPPPLVTK